MLSHKDVVEYLHDLEKRYPVEKWQYQGVYFWPFYKVKIFFLWFNHAKILDEVMDDTIVLKNGSVNRFKELIKSLFSWLLLFTQRVPESRFIFSASRAHRGLENGISYNKFFDPAMDYLEDFHNESMLLEYLPHSKKENAYKKQRVINLKNLYPIINLIVKTKNRNKVEWKTLVNYEEFELEVITKLGLSSKKIRSQIDYSLNSILVWRALYGYFIDRIKPQKVFSLCYYSLPVYGMYLAATERKVDTVEMQHGPQDFWHVAYGYFGKHPQGGYGILPKIFWTWDTTSAQSLNSWTSKHLFYSIVVGGNPWLVWSKLSTNQFLKSDKIKVLYTLQPLEPILEPYVLEAILTTKDSHEWMLRVHPRQLNQISQIKSIFEHHKVLKIIDIDQATNLPLPTVLKSCDVHISKSSGSIIEAGMLGIKSLILESLGVEAYKEEIKEGRSYPFLGSDANDFIQWINRAAKEKKLLTMEPLYKLELEKMLAYEKKNN